MNTATYLAFRDELEKIALLQNVGNRIVAGVKAVPGLLKATPGAIQGGIQNAGKAVGAFATPAQSMKAGWKTTVTDFKSMSPAMKGLMGLGLIGSAHEVASKEDPYGKGRSRVERAFTAAGDQAGGIIGAPFGLAGGLVAGQIGRKAGALVGKGVDRLRGYKAPQAPAAQVPPQAGV